MFESFSSRANQSAVDKLIQLATGNKGSAPVEEERPAPEHAEAAADPVEASTATEQPPVSEPAAEAGVEAAPSEAPVESAPSETPVEARPQVSDLIKSLAEKPQPAEPAQPEQEVVDDRPFYEPVAEAAHPEPVVEPAVEAPPPAPPAEAVSEPVVEAAPEPPPPPPVQEPEPVVEERPFQELVAEAPVESAQAAPVEEPAPAAPPAEPVREAKPEAAVDDRPFHESPQEAPQEAAKEAAAPVEAAAKSTTEEPAGEQPAQAAADAGHDGDKPVASTEGGKDPGGKAGQDDPFDLEKFRQRQAERRRGRGADIFPSPDETTFLRSRYRDSQRDEVTEEELKTLSRDPMWKTLVQFKGWLPVVTRVLPLLDLAGKRASSGNTEEIKDSVEGLLVSNRDMRTTLQNQTVEMKRVEEEISRLREASDKNAFEQNAISEDVRGIQKLMKNAFLYLGILLGLMVVAVGYMAFLVFTYLNHPMH